MWLWVGLCVCVWGCLCVCVCMYVCVCACVCVGGCEYTFLSVLASMWLCLCTCQTCHVRGICLFCILTLPVGYLLFFVLHIFNNCDDYCIMFMYCPYIYIYISYYYVPTGILLFVVVMILIWEFVYMYCSYVYMYLSWNKRNLKLETC